MVLCQTGSQKFFRTFRSYWWESITNNHICGAVTKDFQNFPNIRKNTENARSSKMQSYHDNGFICSFFFFHIASLKLEKTLQMFFEIIIFLRPL
jgi:hypothetical protein